MDSIQSLLREAAASKITLDSTTLEYKVRKRVEKEAAEFAANPSDLPLLERISKLLDLIPSLPFPVVLWEAQNVCYRPFVTAFEQNGWHSPGAGSGRDEAPTKISVAWPRNCTFCCRRAV